jgi:hypothetical protein
MREHAFEKFGMTHVCRGDTVSISKGRAGVGKERAKGA